MTNPFLLQLGTSSRSIHGGAYFSAVSGRKFNLTTVLRPCRPLACYWMVFFPPSVTFVLVFTDLPSPSGLARYFQVDLSPKRLDGFLSNRTDCISPNRPWLHWLLHEAVFNDVHVLMQVKLAFHYPICCISITIGKRSTPRSSFFIFTKLPNSQLCHVNSSENGDKDESFILWKVKLAKAKQYDCSFAWLQWWTPLFCW